MSDKPKTLVCIREAVIPGRGHFQVGDEITDKELIAAIGQDHPCFVVKGQSKEDK